MVRQRLRGDHHRRRGVVHHVDEAAQLGVVEQMGVVDHDRGVWRITVAGARANTVTPASRSAARTAVRSVVLPVPIPPDTRALAGSVGDAVSVATTSAWITER